MLYSCPFSPSLRHQYSQPHARSLLSSLLDLETVECIQYNRSVRAERFCYAVGWIQLSRAVNASNNDWISADVVARMSRSYYVFSTSRVQRHRPRKYGTRMDDARDRSHALFHDAPQLLRAREWINNGRRCLLCQDSPFGCHLKKQTSSYS
jgi:hypothetical protein